MADNEEVFKLLIQAEGQEILPKLQAQLAATNDAFGNLAAAFGRGELDEKQFADQSKALADTHRNLAKAIKEVEDASGKGSSKMAGFGQSALQAGRVVQDFAQGGIGGILNNIEGFTQALGGGAGLAGILTIVGVGFMVLKPQIMAFWEALNAGNAKEALSNFDRLSARIKELKDNPAKLEFDRRELDEAEKQFDRLKRGQAEFQAGQKKQTVEQAESGKLVDEALTAAGQPEAEARMKSALQRQMEATDGPLAEIRKKIAIEDANAAQAKKDMQSGGLEDTMAAEAQLKIAEGNRAKLLEEANKRRGAIGENAGNEVGSIIDLAKSGNSTGDRNQAAKQRQLVDLLRATGQDKLAAQVERANPGRIAQDNALNRQGAEQEAAGKIAAEADKAREAADKRADAVPFKPKMLGGAGAASFGPANAPKGKIDSDAERRAAAVAARARQVEAQSQFFTGQQFGGEQSKAIAERSLKLQGQGLDANRATLAAMREAMQAMNAMTGRINALEQQAQGFQGNFRQVNRRNQQRQPSALNSGGPM